jgi:hypothetical protein
MIITKAIAGILLETNVYPNGYLLSVDDKEYRIMARYHKTSKKPIYEHIHSLTRFTFTVHEFFVISITYGPHKGGEWQSYGKLYRTSEDWDNWDIVSYKIRNWKSEEELEDFFFHLILDGGQRN